jgi:excisionase family DNA binding protein
MALLMRGTQDLSNMRKVSHNENQPVLFFDKESKSLDPMELLTIKEVAQMLRISIPGVRRLQTARHIPFFKIGGSVRFSKSDIVAYLERSRIEAIGT